MNTSNINDFSLLRLGPRVLSDFPFGFEAARRLTIEN